MPEELALDDDVVRLGIEPRPHRPDDLRGDLLLDALAFAVAGIKREGDRVGRGGIGREQEAQGLVGVLQSSGGVQARAQSEAHVTNADDSLQSGDLLERDQPRPGGFRQSRKSGGDEDAVLAGQRNQIRDGAERGEIEKGADIERLRFGPAQFAAALGQGMKQLEGEAGGAEFTEVDCGRAGLVTSAATELGIDQGHGGGERIGYLMMIQNDHIDSPALQPGDRLHGGGTAVDGEQKSAWMLLQAIGRAVGTQAVAFVHPMRQIGLHPPPEPGHAFDEQRAGTDSIHVVVSEEHEAFATAAGVEQTFDGSGHSREEERILEAFENGFEERGGLGRIGVATVDQATSQQGFDPELPFEPRHLGGFGPGDDPAVAAGAHSAPPEKNFWTRVFTPPTPSSAMSVRRTAKAIVVRTPSP